MGFRPLPPIPPIPPMPPMPPIPQWSTRKTTVTKVKPVAHTIYICTPNDQELVDHIYAAIVGMGVRVSAADTNNGSLYDDEPGAKTTIVAICVDNFNTKLEISDILNRITERIAKYKYFGIVLRGPSGSTWRAGNVRHDEFKKILSKVKAPSTITSEAKPEPETKPDSKPEPEPKPEPEKTEEPKSKGRIDLQLLSKVVRATVDMSDIFFEDITQADRRLLARELEKLCENSGITIEDLATQPVEASPKL